MIHPDSPLRMHRTAIANDGWMQAAPFECDTLIVVPGERWDVLNHANLPGMQAFHCHIQPHAESPMGMLGMVAALIVQK